MEIKNVKTSKIIPYSKNPRINNSAVDKTAKSITAYGWQQPIVVDKNGIVVAGHTRLKAAKKLGLDECPVLVAKDLTDEQIQAYRIADNKTGELATWDLELLSVELQDLSDMGFDMELTGFDSDELVDLLDNGKQGGLTDDDVIPDVPEEPITKLGDLWLLGEHRLLCGDSTDIKQVEKLMDGKKADMVFTDPPYGVDYDGGSKKREKLNNDQVGTDIYEKVVPIITSICNGPIYTWYADTKPSGLYNSVKKYGDIHALIIWVKNNSTFNMNIHYKQKHEPCLYWKAKGKRLCWSGNNKEDTVWRFDREVKNEFHPTQKPVGLAERAILNHSVGLIIDLFLGSGSTLIACEKTNRKCYGMELDPHYCDVIIKRWEEYTGKKAILQEA